MHQIHYQESDKEVTPTAEKNSTFAAVDKEMDDTFKFNPGKERAIFSEDHPYFQVPKEDVAFAKENFGLPIPEVEKPVEAFKEHKTIKEAEEYAKNVLGCKYANFKGADIDVVNDMCTAIIADIDRKTK